MSGGWDAASWPWDLGGLFRLSRVFGLDLVTYLRCAQLSGLHPIIGQCNPENLVPGRLQAGPWIWVKCPDCPDCLA